MVPRRSGNPVQRLSPSYQSKAPWLQVDCARRRNGSLDQTLQYLGIDRRWPETARRPPMIDRLHELHHVFSRSHQVFTLPQRDLGAGLTR